MKKKYNHNKPSSAFNFIVDNMKFDRNLIHILETSNKNEHLMVYRNCAGVKSRIRYHNIHVCNSGIGAYP